MSTALAAELIQHSIRTVGLEGPWTLESASRALEESLIRMPLTRDSSIHFEWHCNRWLLSCHGQASEGDHLANLRGFMGFLPFTAEDGGARRGIIETVRSVPHCSRGQLRIDRRGRLFFGDSIRLPDPVTPHTLITSAVVMLLQAKPIVDAIRPFLTGASPREPVSA